jgi:hypothetical protein
LRKPAFTLVENHDSFIHLNSFQKISLFVSYFTNTT